MRSLKGRNIDVFNFFLEVEESNLEHRSQELIFLTNLTTNFLQKYRKKEKKKKKRKGYNFKSRKEPMDAT